MPRTESIAQKRVFDDRGVGAPCGPPPPGGCEPLPASSPFIDACRLAGFGVLQCGCAPRCTGDVVTLSKHYDASGEAKDCAPARADCTPPSPGAAFQDACAERGFRLDTCGCEILCSGDFKKPL